MSEPIILKVSKRYKFYLDYYEDDYLIAGINTDGKRIHLWDEDHDYFIDANIGYIIATVVSIDYNYDFITINASDVEYL